MRAQAGHIHVLESAMLALLLSRSARIVFRFSALAAVTKRKTEPELMGVTVAASGMLKSETIRINVFLSVFIRIVYQ